MSRYLVKLSSKMISYEWWGQQWCQNIAEYADYSNRLERGRAYIRKGAVKEINISDGHITAMVKGTRPQAYKVEISVDPVSDVLSQKILNQIKDISDLRNGKVPDNCRNIFTVDKGLFPKAREIKFACSCPDIAYMCKHVAAVLYAVGSILDQEPLLLFQLRGIDVEEYLDKQLFDATNEMLLNINSRSDNERMIADDMLADLFGIDIATDIEATKDTPEIVKPQVDEVRVIEILPKSKRKQLCVPKPKKNPLEGFVIIQYTLDGDFVAEYSSFEEIESKTTVGVLNVKRACAGTKQSAGGFQWKKYKTGTQLAKIMPLENIVSNGFGKAIQCLDDNGNLIASYASVAEAVRETGVNSKSIRDAAKGIQKHAGGFVWKYTE